MEKLSQVLIIPKYIAPLVQAAIGQSVMYPYVPLHILLLIFKLGISFAIFFLSHLSFIYYNACNY